MDCYTSVVVVLTLLGMQELVDADCYPGDKQYTDITEEIYKNVIGDTINGLRGYGPLTRFQLCSLLVTNHNSGKLHGTGQINTNHDFLGQPISLSSCVNALVNLKGYQTDEGWKKWAGSHVGTWWFTSKSLSDNARWDQPQLKDNSRTYFVQKIEFFSQWRKDNSKHVNQAGTTCKFGWHQSGSGIEYVWGWDPKNDDSSSGAVIGFTFNEGSISCIVWVSSEEAFLECVRNYQSHKKRTSCTHDGGRYGQWNIY